MLVLASVGVSSVSHASESSDRSITVLCSARLAVKAERTLRTWIMVEQQSPSGPRSLSDACLQTIIDSPGIPRELYKVSVDELVDLNSKQHQVVKQELSHIRNNRYLVDPPVIQKRVGKDVYERVRKVTSAWEPAYPQDVSGFELSSITNMTGPNKLQLVYDHATKQVSYQTKHGYGSGSNSLAYATVISSALLMYRLCCLFACDVSVQGPAGYKLVWSIYLRHKASGIFVGFSEWKGNALYRASKFPPAETSFYDDWLALLNLLLDPCCPHPYDGTVAGSVA